jgi:uncharacterized protein YejL (UPF0352 family)
MKPLKSNLDKKGCIPVSSNCVIWEGPDLCCIPTCNDDTVSDVIFNLSQEVCYHKALLDLTDLNLGNLVAADRNLITILQAIINKIQ